MAFFWRLFFVVTLFCIPLGATAQENRSAVQQPDANGAKTGVGIVCNTPQQIERYLNLHIAGAEPSAALATVNAEAQNSTACGIVDSAFVETREISKVSISSGFLRLVKITVLATRNTLGWHRVPPTVQYTALFVKAQEV